MNAHTPGTWTDDGDGLVSATIDGERSTIASVNTRKGRNGDVETNANAKLIAAAPTLFAVLERVACHVPASDPEGRKLVQAALRAAAGATSAYVRHGYPRVKLVCTGCAGASHWSVRFDVEDTYMGKPNGYIELHAIEAKFDTRDEAAAAARSLGMTIEGAS